MCRIGVCKEQGRSTAGVGQKQELGRSREREREGEGETMMMTTMTTNDDEDHHYPEREIERHKAARGSAIGQYKAVILNSLKYS